MLSGGPNVITGALRSGDSSQAVLRGECDYGQMVRETLHADLEDGATSQGTHVTSERWEINQPPKEMDIPSEPLAKNAHGPDDTVRPVSDR